MFQKNVFLYMQNMYNPWYPHNSYYQPYMGVMNNQMGLMNNPHYEELRMTQEQVRICQAKMAAHAFKVEELINSIKKDKNLEIDTKMEALHKRNNGAQHFDLDDDEEERMLDSLYRRMKAKKEMHRTKEKLSVIKEIIHKELWSEQDAERAERMTGEAPKDDDLLPGFSDVDGV